MLARLVWMGLGIISTLLGLLGLLLPILPGILFLLFAVYCFARAANTSGTGASPGVTQLRSELGWDRDSGRRRAYRPYRRR